MSGDFRWCEFQNTMPLNVSHIQMPQTPHHKSTRLELEMQWYNHARLLQRTFLCPLSKSINIAHMMSYAIILKGYKTWFTQVTDKNGNRMNRNLAEWRKSLWGTGWLETECASAQEIGLCWCCAYVFVCPLTVCLGTGGSPDGLFVSASSLRMWSVLMYESYRPSPWRAGNKNEQRN